MFIAYSRRCPHLTVAIIPPQSRRPLPSFQHNIGAEASGERAATGCRTGVSAGGPPSATSRPDQTSERLTPSQPPAAESNVLSVSRIQPARSPRRNRACQSWFTYTHLGPRHSEFDQSIVVLGKRSSGLWISRCVVWLWITRTTVTASR